jgi:DNA-binding transcriptional LysR family regulator
MAMELRHLRYFIAVAEEGHITRGAERLGIQQPPLSQQIKAMERELDVQLFHRKARGVELTDAGRVFLDDARAILAQLDQATETTRRTARGEQGRICVGITTSCPYHPFVPKVIRAFRNAHPLVFLTLEDNRPSALIELLQNGRVDAVFTRTPPANPEGVVVIKLLDEPIFAALPGAHPLARRNRGATIPLSALANETFIAYASQHGLRASTFEAIRAAGINLRIGQEVPRLTSALSFVAAGLGIVFVPASMQRLRMDGVEYRRIEDAAQLTAPLILVSRRSDPSAVVQHFLRLAKKAAKDFTEDPAPASPSRRGSRRRGD